MKLTFTVAALTAFVSAADPSFNDATYIGKNAMDKVSQILTSGHANTTPQDWFNAIEMAGLLTEAMTPTMK